MILPRLIVADEYRPGKVPAGVLIASALKEMGYKLKLFAGSVDETALRSLQLLCNQPVTLLDPILCGERENFRWLFQCVASPECINLVITNLGARWTKDSPFRIPRECLLLCEWLDCEMIPVVYSDTSSTITVKTVMEIVRQLESAGDARGGVHSILFRSVLNNREYELLERELGRHLSSISIGSVPKAMDRDLPSVVELCSEEAGRGVLPLRSASRQLRGPIGTVMWPYFSAMAQVAPRWSRQPSLCDPIAEAGKVNIAVIRHPVLTLGGDGTERLMQALGCNLVDVPLEGAIGHSVPIHGVYIPHGLSHLVLPKFFGNLYVKTMLTRGSSGSSFLLAEGGSSPLLGDKIQLPSGGGEGRGFGAMSFTSVYKGPAFVAPHKRILRAAGENPLLSGRETAWGYGSANLVLESEGDEGCWETSENRDDPPSGFEGRAFGRALATAMRVEFWSCPDSFRRWLEG